MIFPDYAFGHDHRDFFSAAIKAQGGEVVELIPIPPTESSFTRYFPQIPADTEVLYHVMVGPAVLTFVKELGEHFGSNRPQIFGFIDSLEAVPLNEPRPRVPRGHLFLGRLSALRRRRTRREFDKFYREKVGVDENGASISDPNDISTYSHMFGCWETLYVIKQAIEASGYKSATDADKKALIEATEAIDRLRGEQRASAGRQDLQRQDPPGASATRTSRRWKAASSTSCTAPRSRTGCTSRRRTTRRWRFERVDAPVPIAETLIASASPGLTRQATPLRRWDAGWHARIRRPRLDDVERRSQSPQSVRAVARTRPLARGREEASSSAPSLKLWAAREPARNRMTYEAPVSFGPHLFLAVLEGAGRRRRAGADRARPVARLRRHAHRQRRAWRVLHARRGARLVLREPRSRRTRRSASCSRSSCSPLIVGAVALARRAAGAEAAQLRSGGDDRRHHRPPLHHPAAGADLLRAGRAAGAGADQLPHRSSPGSAIPATSSSSSPPRSRCSSPPGSC